MADDQGQNPNPEQPPAQPEANGQQQQEPQTFSREYVHELREEAKTYRQKMQAFEAELQQFRDAQKQQSEKQLAEQGEWKTLAEQREQELRAIQVQNERTRKEAAVIAAAAKADFTDPMDAVKMLNLDNLKFENDTVAGLPEALAELTKAKPYLLKQQPQQEQGQQQRRSNLSATNPAGGNQTPYTTRIGEGSIGGAGVIRKS